MTKIAVPIKPMIRDEGLSLMGRAIREGAEIVEIWCDQLRLEDAKDLVRLKDCPIIINLKDKSENGKFVGTMRERLNYLETVASYGADYVDIPFTPELTATDLEKLKDKLLLSYHNFTATPPLPDLEDLIDKMAALNPAAIKLSTQVNREIDLINLFKLQVNYPKYRDQRVIIGMGDKGKVSRLLAPMFHNIFMFAALDHGHETAEGQLTVAELKHEWAKLGMDNWIENH